MDNWSWEALQRELIKDWQSFRIDYGADTERAERAWRVRVANLLYHALNVGDVPVEKYMTRLTGKQAEASGTAAESEAAGNE